LAVYAQQAENQWVGVKCGVMDQMISALGQPGHALLIDCHPTLETRLVPLPQGITVVIMDTTKRRELKGSNYNERRESCELAAKQLGVKLLCDLNLTDFMAQRGSIKSGMVFKRALHVIGENDRTLKAAQALTAGDTVICGHLMSQSHTSLRDDFEVSCPELDAMVQAAQSHAACLGARMTGAGFGGCAVALVANDGLRDFMQTVSNKYYQVTRLEPNLYACQASAGVTVEAL